MNKINKKDIIIFIIGLLILVPALYYAKNYFEEKESIDMDEIVTDDVFLSTGIYMVIDDHFYEVEIEENKLGKEFIDLLPLEIEMTELNGNEKYYELDKNLSSNDKKVGTINKGDLMLYNGNTIVLFYDTFDSNYSYTRIGKVKDEFNLDNSNVKVKFIKEGL